ncbi:MAG: TetR/AcrR family transcriptional regulator [Nitrospirae bacterium]|nr:MAG: TetR/AcrR family transcriptional regulator [Nitrospirota bacterium]
MGRASQAKEKLLDSAIELVYRRSYASVGVQELCEYAGVKKGSFYHFFPSKRDLTLAVLDRLLDRVRTTIFDKALMPSRSPIKALERWIALIYADTCAVKQRIGHVLGCPIGNLGIELSAQDEAIRRKVEAIFDELSGRLERVIQEGIAVGAIPNQPARKTARALLAYIEGLHLLAKTTNDPEVIRRLGYEYVRRLTCAATRSAGPDTRKS